MGVGYFAPPPQVLTFPYNIGFRIMAILECANKEAQSGSSDPLYVIGFAYYI